MSTTRPTVEYRDPEPADPEPTFLRLNVGNCWDWSFLERIIVLNKTLGKENNIKVTSLFGSLPFFTPSARSSDRLLSSSRPIPGPAGAGDLEGYVHHAKSAGIGIRYTLNQSCIGPMQDFDKALWPQLKLSLDYLYKSGIHEYTITSPLLMELMRENFPDTFLEVSTICEVDTVQKLKRWAELDVDGVCAKLDANRDTFLLKLLSDTCAINGIVMEVLANEFCLLGCAWRQECYNLSSHDSQRGPFDHYPFGRCQKVRLSNPSEWIKAGFILPQWMQLYSEQAGVSAFKITGRTHPPRVILPIIEKYMSRKHTGNLLELWPTIAALAASEEPQQGTYIDTEEVEKHFKHLTSSHCSIRSCEKCGYCETIFKSAQRRTS